ncbi:hypothetical protein L1049_020705 [Liquidambar formosana]|uniref:Uncharacterized protein n=1 Tax=Liquidambar formosana TaxID=63359 RepID=A0AAP0SDH8_LIQFO
MFCSLICCTDLCWNESFFREGVGSFQIVGLYLLRKVNSVSILAARLCHVLCLYETILCAFISTLKQHTKSHLIIIVRTIIQRKECMANYKLSLAYARKNGNLLNICEQERISASLGPGFPTIA